ncbi:MAG: hypothetical protein ACK523_18765, partial [Pirellulaceae bacterium]
VHHLAMDGYGDCGGNLRISSDQIHVLRQRVAPTSGSHRGHAVEIFDRRRIWIVHHLAIDGYGDCGGGTGKAITTNLRGPHGSLCRE